MESRGDVRIMRGALLMRAHSPRLGESGASIALFM